MSNTKVGRRSMSPGSSAIAQRAAPSAGDREAAPGVFELPRANDMTPVGVGVYAKELDTHRTE
jgi:hypothetical protein